MQYGQCDMIELTYSTQRIIAIRQPLTVDINNCNNYESLFNDLCEKCYQININGDDITATFSKNGANYKDFEFHHLNNDDETGCFDTETMIFETTIRGVKTYITNIINGITTQIDTNKLSKISEFISKYDETIDLINGIAIKELKKDLPKIINRKGHEEENKRKMLNYCLNEFNNTSNEMINIVHDYTRNLKRIVRSELSFLKVINEMIILTTLGDGSFIPNVLTNERTIKTIDLSLITHNYYFAGAIISYDLTKIEQSKAIKHLLFKFVSCLIFNYDERKLNNLTYINAKSIKIFGVWNGITDINKLYGFNNRTIKRYRTNTKTGFDNKFIKWQIYWINEMMKTQKQKKLCYMIGGEFNILSYVPPKDYREKFENYAERVKELARRQQEQEQELIDNVDDDIDENDEQNQSTSDGQQELIDNVDDDIDENDEPHPKDDFDDFIDY